MKASIILRVVSLADHKSGGRGPKTVGVWGYGNRYF
jgi:hypothetical protein